MNISNIDGRITINGKQYRGSSVSIDNGRIIIDGKDVEGAPTTGEISVVVTGDCFQVENGSGPIMIKGSVKGNVNTGSGDIQCGNIAGSVGTGSGDVNCGNVGGSIKTGSGDVSTRRS